MVKEKNSNKINKNILQIFESDEFGKVNVILVNGEPYFDLYSVGMALGQVKKSKDVLYPRKDRIDQNVKNAEIKPVVHNGQPYISENQLYDLMLEVHTDRVRPFRKWVTSVVLPTVRKTGGYVDNDTLFIDTYLPFADENTKLLFSATLETVRKQNELLEKQQNEILHKQEVINGFTNNIDIYKKKDIINRICRRRHENYANRYKELYKCFRENYHIDLEARCEGYNSRQNKAKDRLTIIKYAENFGFIDDLYFCCVKLYETEVKELINRLNDIQD